MPELLSCPFCGSDNVELRSSFRAEYQGCMSAFVKCWNCHARSDIKDSCAIETEAEAIAAWNTRPSSWISVDDKLPEEDNSWVLVYADGAINCMAYHKGEWLDWTYSPCHNIRIEDITHWMSLPEAPEAE